MRRRRCRHVGEQTLAQRAGKDGLICIENNHYRMDDRDVGKVVEIKMDGGILTVLYGGKVLKMLYGGKVLKRLNKTADAFNPEMQEMSTDRDEIGVGKVY